MQFIGEQGLSVGELERLARTRTNLNRMERWGYIVVEPGPRSSRLIRATPRGRQAQELWRPLFHAIEQRWRSRFGEGRIDQLRESLATLISRIDTELPDYLPILHYALFAQTPMTSIGGKRNAKMAGIPIFHYRLFSRECCWRLPSSSRANRTCRLPSAPTSCEFLMRRESGSRTFRS